MILVSVGNATQPFDRFLHAVEAALQLLGVGDVVWQVGTCRHVPGPGRVERFLRKEEFEAVLSSAAVYICQAGVGSVMEGVLLGKTPIVMARRRGEGEVVNDHQRDLERELVRLGWVLRGESATEIASAVRRVLTGGTPVRPSHLQLLRPRLERLLSEVSGRIERESGE